MIRIYTDGAYHEPTNRASIGAVLLDDANRQIAVCAAAFEAPPWWTSTLSERHAALEALVHALLHTAGPVLLRVDDRSLVDVFTATGPRRARDLAGEAVAEYEVRLRAAAAAFSSFSCRWVPREWNERADALADLALRSDAIAGRVAPANGLLPRIGEWAVRGPSLAECAQRSGGQAPTKAA